jgi:hypothetical protein
MAQPDPDNERAGAGGGSGRHPLQVDACGDQEQDDVPEAELPAQTVRGRVAFRRLPGASRNAGAV